MTNDMMHCNVITWFPVHGQIFKYFFSCPWSPHSARNAFHLNLLIIGDKTDLSQTWAKILLDYIPFFSSCSGKLRNINNKNDDDPNSNLMKKAIHIVFSK